MIEVALSLYVDYKYTDYKSLLLLLSESPSPISQKTLGIKNELTKAIKRAEEKPTSPASKSELHEAATEIKADGKDEKQDILKLAQALLEILKNQPDGASHIQNAQGNYIAQADRGSTASVTINGEKK